MFGDVDLFALDEPRLERFGQHSPAGKPANELHPGLATAIGTALVDRDLGDEVAITRAIAKRWSTPSRIPWPFEMRLRLVPPWPGEGQTFR